MPYHPFFCLTLDKKIKSSDATQSPEFIHGEIQTFLDKADKNQNKKHVKIRFRKNGNLLSFRQ